MVSYPTLRDADQSPTRSPLPAQLPDNLVTRLIVRLSIVAVDAVPLIALIHTAAAYATYPAPPAVALTTSLAPEQAADFLVQHKFAFSCLSLWLALEVLWWPLARVSAYALDRGYLDLRHDDVISPEERWRLWTKLLESTRDPQEWLQAFFLTPGATTAPRGADDPAIAGVQLDKVGRSNIEEVSLPVSRTPPTCDAHSRCARVVCRLLHVQHRAQEAQAQVDRERFVQFPRFRFRDIDSALTLVLVISRDAFNDPAARSDHHSFSLVEPATVQVPQRQIAAPRLPPFARATFARPQASHLLCCDLVRKSNGMLSALLGWIQVLWPKNDRESPFRLARSPSRTD